MLQTRDNDYKIYCLHDEAEESQHLKKPKQKQNESAFDFHSDKLDQAQHQYLNNLIQPHIISKMKKDTNHYEWQKTAEYSIEQPPSSQDKFLSVLPNKKHVVMIFQLSSSEGFVEVVVNCSDKFVASDFIAQAHHSYADKTFSEGGKMLTSRSNDESFLTVLDKNPKNLASNTKEGTKRHANNVKTFVEVLPSGINTYIDGNKLINVSFQDPNQNTFNLQDLGKHDDMIFISLDVWTLEVSKKQPEVNKSLLHAK